VRRRRGSALRSSRAQPLGFLPSAPPVRRRDRPSAPTARRQVSPSPPLLRRREIHTAPCAVALSAPCAVARSTALLSCAAETDPPLLSCAVTKSTHVPPCAAVHRSLLPALSFSCMIAPPCSTPHVFISVFWYILTMDPSILQGKIERSHRRQVWELLEIIPVKSTGKFSLRLLLHLVKISLIDLAGQ
jgi:hypothetical protein